jgi:hypothetical protein
MCIGRGLNEFYSALMPLTKSFYFDVKKVGQQGLEPWTKGL